MNRDINLNAKKNIILLVVFAYLTAAILVLPSLSNIIQHAQQTEQARIQILGD